jgi:hypothetical protein
MRGLPLTLNRVLATPFGRSIAPAHVNSGELSRARGSEPRRTLLFGPDRAGNLLEIVVLELDDGSRIAIHAMRMRRNYNDLLP